MWHLGRFYDFFVPSVIKNLFCGFAKFLSASQKIHETILTEIDSALVNKKGNCQLWFYINFTILIEFYRILFFEKITKNPQAILRGFSSLFPRVLIRNQCKSVWYQF